MWLWSLVASEACIPKWRSSRACKSVNSVSGLISTFKRSLNLFWFSSTLIRLVTYTFWTTCALCLLSCCMVYISSSIYSLICSTSSSSLNSWTTGSSGLVGSGERAFSCCLFWTSFWCYFWPALRFCRFSWRFWSSFFIYRFLQYIFSLALLWINSMVRVVTKLTAQVA